jgi:hypothetical protein
LYLIPPGTFAPSKTKIVIKDQGNANEALFRDLLKLGLSKSGNSQQYDIVTTKLNASEARSVEISNSGYFAVIWVGIQDHYETDLTPICIPVMKGMLGQRIFIIRQDDQQ